MVNQGCYSADQAGGWCWANDKQFQFIVTMQECDRMEPAEASEPSSEEEEIIVKNIETGEAHSVQELTRDLSPLQPGQRVWKSYFSSLKNLSDQLLQLLMKKDHSSLEKFLVEYPVDLTELRYLGGWTLLHFAISVNDPVSADLLLRMGLDGNAQTSEMKRTALQEAALGNKVELVEMLVGWGVDPNLADSDRNTAIHFAVDFGYCEVVKSLLASSIPVDLDIRNNANMTPFNTCRSPDIFEILITYTTKTQKEGSKQSAQTASSVRQRNTYESRLIVRNSEVVPHTSRADMVERFLSVREQPLQRKSSSQLENESIISEESYEDSLSSSQNLDSPLRKGKKGLKKVGSYLRSNIKSSFKIASQNVGLMRESIIKTHLEHEQLIENFDKLRKLGSGTFAEVYLVRKKKSSSLFALKVIDKVRIAEDGLRRYVYAEREILTQLSHPFLLHAYDCFQDFTHLYILTEFCQGGDLEKVVRKGGLSESIARTYVCEAALAIQELHQNQMLYRDLKTSNALLDEEGHLRLADFGLAKKATQSGSFLGSMNYLAPEMLVKEPIKQHGRALDWYLLGVFAYELLHGLPPFYCEERQEAERRVLKEKPAFREEISPSCRELIEALLEKDPGKRVVGLGALKGLSWLGAVEWGEVREKKGEVVRPEVESWKELRKKEYFGEEEGDKLIDERIEWYQNWNYPPLEKNSPLR